MGKSKTPKKRPPKKKTSASPRLSISPALAEQCELLRLDIREMGKVTLLKGLKEIEDKYFDSDISFIYGWDELTDGLGFLEKFLDAFGPHIKKGDIAKQFLQFRKEVPLKVFRKHFRRMVITFYRIEEYACRKSFSRDFLHFFNVLLDLLDELS